MVLGLVSPRARWSALVFVCIAFLFAIKTTLRMNSSGGNTIAMVAPGKGVDLRDAPPMREVVATQQRIEEYLVCIPGLERADVNVSVPDDGRKFEPNGILVVHAHRLVSEKERLFLKDVICAPFRGLSPANVEVVIIDRVDGVPQSGEGQKDSGP